MRAVIQPRYGNADVLELADVPEPRVRDGEVRVQVKAASLNGADAEILSGRSIVRVTGPLRPQHRIPGSDVAGVVVEVGPNVTRLGVGDEVFGDLFSDGFGAFAELVTAPETSLIAKPPDLTFEQVATLPQAGALAWQSLHDGAAVGAGERVLISGAGGGVGTFAVQLAVAAGAHVTGVDRAAKEELVRSLGAADFIGFEAQDFTRTGERYDRIVDVQARRSVRAISRALRAGGRYLAVGGLFPRIIETVALGAVVGRLNDQRFGIVAWQSNDPEITAGLIASIRAGNVTPVIERTYPLEETPQAFRRLESGELGGKIVIVVG